MEETPLSLNNGQPASTGQSGEVEEEDGNLDNAVSDEAEAQGMRRRMEAWLNRAMRIRMSDGRTLVGTFICTDKHRNVILSSCEEYVNPPDSAEKEEPRVLGLAMVPGQYIVSIEIDEGTAPHVPPSSPHPYETGCPGDEHGEAHLNHLIDEDTATQALVL